MGIKVGAEHIRNIQKEGKNKMSGIKKNKAGVKKSIKEIKHINSQAKKELKETMND